jgi:hypothetical protein
LATIEFTNLVREWKKPEVSDIVQAALNLVTKRIEKYSILAKTGKLHIKVFLQLVDLT